MNLEYIPYIKYVISPGTRFEADKKVLFDPDGEVAQGKPLINYGWAPSGLKELIEALYKSRKGTLAGFESFYNKKVLRCKGNIVDVLRKEGLVGEKFPWLLRIRIKERVEVPALLANVDRMYFKRCNRCGQNWRSHGAPEDFAGFLEDLELQKIKEMFQCSRQVCKFLCDNYRYCSKSYTSTEGNEKVEKEKLRCLKELFKQIAGKSTGSKRYECIPKEKIPSRLSCRSLIKLPEELPLTHANLVKLINRDLPISCTSCIERHLRFDFIPLRYFFFDYKTWSKMQKHRYSKKPMHNIDALPAELLSEFINSYDKYLEGTQLIAPINHEGILEAFLNVSKVKFEIKLSLRPHECSVCGFSHRIIDIPIKAMFRDSDVYKHEANFAKLLWRKLWEKYPAEFCKTFGGKTSIKISESTVLRREMKAKEIDPLSRFALSSYDYVVDLTDLGKDRLLLFDLTTALWKKSGFHEVGMSPEEYVEMWKELLFDIPYRKINTIATWYIVINSTEEMFFDETAPQGVKNLSELVNLLTLDKNHRFIMIQSKKDVDLVNVNEHKLVVIPIFNSTQPKGEARWEIKRLEKENFEKLVIWDVTNRLLS